ncbi:putative DNA-binding transcriptional regulator AlpA [Bradyrhizobium sp. GM24.11]
MSKTKSKAPAVQQEDSCELTQFVETTMVSKPGAVGEYFLTKKALCEKVGLTFPFVWQMIREGKFPEGRAVGSRTLWISSEIDAWILARPARVYRKSAERAGDVLKGPDGHSHKSTADYAAGRV